MRQPDGEFAIWIPASIPGDTLVLEREPDETDQEYAGAIEHWRTVLFGLLDFVGK